MINHAPLSGREFFSLEKDKFLKKELRKDRTRCNGIANVVSALPRPTKPEQTIWDGYYINAKLHDREPEAVVEELERRWPDFFDGFPTKNKQPATIAQKKEFIGEWCRVYIKQGLRQYGKPKLRKNSKSDDLAEIG